MSRPTPDASRVTGLLVEIPLDRLRAHPLNSNVMSADRRAKLRANIAAEGDYPPVIVRPHPDEDGAFEVLDGHQRWPVLAELGHTAARCYVWPCDNATALTLVATLNRLEGADEPWRRAALLHELTQLLPVEELALRLPEDGDEIERAAEAIDTDLDELLASFAAAAEAELAAGPQLFSFAVDAEDAPIVEAAVARAAEDLEGRNRRGRALVRMAAAYLATRERELTP